MLGVAQHLRHRLQQLPADCSIALHQGPELPEGEPMTDKVGRGRDGRGKAFVPCLAGGLFFEEAINGFSLQYLSMGWLVYRVIIAVRVK